MKPKYSKIFGIALLFIPWAKIGNKFQKSKKKGQKVLLRAYVYIWDNAKRTLTSHTSHTYVGCGKCGR